MLQNNKTRSKKWLMLALSAVLALSVLAGCGKSSGAEAGTGAAKKDDSKVVATYEGGEVTQKEFDIELGNMLLMYPEYAQLINMDQFREYFLKQQVAYEYLQGKASDKSKTEGEKKAKEQLEAMKKQEGFKEALTEKKLTEDDVLKYMTRILTVVVDYNDKVTEDQIKAQFEKDKEEMTVASVRHVLIGFKDKDGKERKKEDALKQAKDISARLKKGEDFAKLAKEYSDDAGSVPDGGLYKDTPVSKWVPQFKEAALTLPINQISDPVETDYGYHVMRVESRTVKTYDKLTEDEKTALRTRAASEIMNSFMEKELDKLITKIDLPKVEEAKPEDKKEEKKEDANKETPKDNGATDKKEDKTEGTK
ncbi:MULTISPECIES: peptidylprolyl isomerase [unclassified Paenibacillus]|uniref:peptidylprolyl isomerase n=1 Tax=unclassified Paenibacillus TaxID=185978 RepID=UPI0002E01613|nr:MULTISPECIES: peptidylprolyl isomerase [unclassified Paenibacillus]MCM3342292.1 peptidylprolyl isomerase [Paenibacillus sp. MER TA 81-3]